MTSTGATYHIIATASGIGNFSDIDALPAKLTRMHLSYKPQTPAVDVSVIFQLENNTLRIYRAGAKTGKYVKVIAEIRRGSWSGEERRELLERMHTCVAQHRGERKAESVDIIVQERELEDEMTVIRNGRWGMWKTTGIAKAAKSDEAAEVKSESGKAESSSSAAAGNVKDEAPPPYPDK